MESTIVSTYTFESRQVDLEALPGYAAFVLENYLEAFSTELLHNSRQEALPILKLFAAYSDDELIALGMKTNTEMLTALAQNNAVTYIELSSRRFMENHLPTVDREDVLVDDITMLSFIRKKTFRQFLNYYTTDFKLFSKVMEEVDRFTAAYEAASFHTYNLVQQEKIQRINEALEHQKQELLEAQDMAEMGSFFWDIHDTSKSQFTPGALKIYELEGPTTLENFMQAVNPADREKVKAAMQKAFYEDGLYETEYTYTINNKQKRIWSRGRVHFRDGKPVSMKGTVMDITRKYNLLQQVMHSEEQYKQAQALTHMGNWSWHIDDNRVEWSDEMYRIYGLEPQSETITLEKFFSFIHPDDKAGRQREINEALETGIAQDYHMRIVHPDGTIKMLKGKGEVITGTGNKPIIMRGTCQDVTGEYLLTNELQQKEKNFKQLINNAPDAIIVINTDNFIKLWNPKATEIFGWTAEEVAGKTLSQTIIPERYRLAHEQGMKHFLKTGEAPVLNKTLDLQAITSDNREIHVSLTVSETVQDGQTAFIAFLRDITQQKLTQLELQQKTTMLEYKNLELENINEELESFNFAASHDLQEPLRKIQTYSSRITELSGDQLDPKSLTYFDKIRSAAQRMQKLIQDLLDHSQYTLKSQEAENVNLCTLITDVKNTFLDAADEKNIRFTVSELPVVHVVRFQFIQLFINLLGNAIKYRKPARELDIAIAHSIIDSSDIDFVKNIPAKKYLRITISDNGIGFDPQYASDIFNLFTRLHDKDKYSGTGIGLATCKKIMHNHAGFINAVSEPGKGSAFHCYLPWDRVVEETV